MGKNSKKSVREKKKRDEKDSNSKKKSKVNSREEIGKSSKDNNKENEKVHKSDSAKESKVPKRNKNETEINKKPDTINKVNGSHRGNTCFLCFCCGGNEDEKLNELILEEEKLREKERKRKEKEEERIKREEEKKEKKKREEEEERERERLILEEQENERLRLLEEKEKLRLLEEEKQKQLEEEKKTKKDTILKKKEIKPKIFAKKKAKLNFIGAASAPNPPPESACVGDPPEVKETSVSIQEGVYLIYNPENDGQLELHYSKTGKKGKGVLAYIHSKTIPDFYFEKNKGREIIFTEVSKKMQSIYINDLKPYYECYIEFIKMKKKFNGVLYFLPAFDEQPPPKLDIVFFDSKAKKLNFVPVEKAVEFKGDYLFIIQKGLEIFKKEINVESLFSYINSYGALLSLS
ncbi:conserved Plasmodium protein, unknown function [Plasmodium relictum]|uniref:Immune mapped protein 2 N-terminal domain-containing protein n=1 Tax=Plasmodium relictum TaxID=85471 RepID=A0A1J1H3Y2_PLARL|nr:conserved Plasmodium protein, unknown function [Plasmodium relictum]CRG99612.1 conserved Plasmodium protein, unknown function [Plasmodium relictum]